MIRHRWVYVVLAAAWIAFAAWLFYDFHRKAEAERTVLRSQGEAVLVALESGIGALERGRSRPGESNRSRRMEMALDMRIEQVRLTLEELVANPSIFGVAILDSGGEEIVSSGEHERWHVPFRAEDSDVWSEGALILTRAVDTRQSAWIESLPVSRPAGSPARFPRAAVRLR